MSPLPLEPPSHLPPHPLSLGCHRTSDLSSEHHTANSQWLSISHLVMYMLQWYSLNSSHLLLSLCPQVCFYVCISFAGLQIHYQYHFSRFCVYALIYNIHFSLSHFSLFSLTSLCIIGSSFIHLTRTDSRHPFLCLSNILLYICTIASF